MLTTLKILRLLNLATSHSIVQRALLIHLGQENARQVFTVRLVPKSRALSELIALAMVTGIQYLVHQGHSMARLV